jgi:[FeFe] hydrogenase H-cluster maturation GTPase HydF
MSVTTDQYIDSLSRLVSPPKLIITDSQVFDYVYQHKPEESMLTSFSVLFAAYKGDIDYYIKGAEVIEGLTSDSRVLIAECCTHAPLEEDIGRVKLPRMLKKMAGENLTVDVVSGTDFPDDLSEYNLIIQCGGCMFNRTYIMSRIGRAQNQNIPMTNYGIAIAKIKGILDKVSLP